MPVYKLGPEIVFPPVRHAVDGLLAVGGDLSPERLLLAYQSGIFPWYSEDEPILWWAPKNRMLLTPSSIHVSRRLSRTIRRSSWRLNADTHFQEVIGQCAGISRKHEDGTWILPEMQQAYTDLHRLGYAHSIELFSNDRLAGGLYGISLGGMFFGESMFSLEANASKVCLIALARQCERWDIGLIDCQMWTGHLASMGANQVSRATYMSALHRHLRQPTRKGAWRLDEDILSACARI